MDVSVVDLSFQSEKPMTKDALHAAMKAASEGSMKGILGYTEEPLVSSDFIGDSRSFDRGCGADGHADHGRRFRRRCMSWYDNEWGFSHRMVDLARAPRRAKRLRAVRQRTMTTLEGITVDRRAAAPEASALFVRVDFNVPLERAAGRSPSHHRRRAHRRGAPHHQACARARRARDPREPPREGRKKGRIRSSLSSRVVRASPSCSASKCTSRRDCIGDAAKKVVFDLRAGQVCLLENLRFPPEEEKDDEAFALKLAELCDVYVDDAFGAVHRAHASVHALPKSMRERGCGFLLEKEIAALGKIITNPDKPFVAVLGGAKVSDKIAVLDSLLEKVDALVIGGAMANTFLAARGANMQASKIEDDKLALARTILEKAREKKIDIVLPIDVVVANNLHAAEGQIVDVGAIPEASWRSTSDRSPSRFQEWFDKAKSVFWNGPMGLFEKPAFSNGTFSVARALAASHAFTVIGGGDSASAVKEAGEGIAQKFSHISTGGGASLELIEGKKLPGIEVLRRSAAAVSAGAPPATGA